MNKVPSQPGNRIAGTFCVIVLLFVVAFYGVAYRIGRGQLAVPADTHRAQPYTRSFYVEAFARVPTSSSHVPQARGVVVNHHLLAPNFIARALATVASTEARTVVLISPNHFGRGQGRLTTTNQNWDTPFGLLPANASVIHALVHSQKVVLDPYPFNGEHGVTGMVAFIKHALPQATIVPILVKDTASNAEISELVAKFARVLPANTLVVGSFDFAHYVPSDLAQFQDVLASAALSGDLAVIERLNIDSQPGLQLFLRTLYAFHAPRFVQLDHTNSGDLTHSPNATDVTSYFTGYFMSGEQKAIARATVYVLGDVVFTGATRAALIQDAYTYFDASFHRTVSGSDVLLAGSTSSTAADQTRLAQLDVQVVQSNNQEVRMFPYDIRGAQIRVVQGNAATSLPTFTSTIANAKAPDIAVIATVRWPQSITNVQPAQQRYARALIDAGADLVVGYSPVPLGQESYQGKAIYYSLGTAVDIPGHTTASVGLGVTVEKNRMAVQTFGFRQHKGMPRPLGQAERDILLLKVGISPFTQIPL